MRDIRTAAWFIVRYRRTKTPSERQKKVRYASWTSSGVSVFEFLNPNPNPIPDPNPSPRNCIEANQKKFMLVGCNIVPILIQMEKLSYRASLHVTTQAQAWAQAWATCEPGRRKRKKKERALVLVVASSRFTRGLCLRLCLCLRRTCKPAFRIERTSKDDQNCYNAHNREHDHSPIWWDRTLPVPVEAESRCSPVSGWALARSVVPTPRARCGLADASRTVRGLAARSCVRRRQQCLPCALFCWCVAKPNCHQQGSDVFPRGACHRASLAVEGRREISTDCVTMTNSVALAERARAGKARMLSSPEIHCWRRCRWSAFVVLVFRLG